MSFAADTARRLREAGLRVTAPRLAVLAVLADHPHATAEVVARLARDELGRVSTQAVYDVLAACTEAGLVRRIEPAGSPARFETRTGDNHHHLVCRSCGCVTDVDCAVGTRPCLTPVEDAGYLLDEAEVVYWGLCPDCQVPDCEVLDCQVLDCQVPDCQRDEKPGEGTDERGEVFA
jgi:Fur family transcriptional regulator, stress-responsive regulator